MLLIERIDPGLHFAELLWRRILGKILLAGGERDGNFQALGERQINRENRTEFCPLFLALFIEGRRSWRLRCGRFVHARVIQSQG